MSEVVEIRTGATVSDVVGRLAATASESSLSLPVPRKIAEGEWVRFAVLLDDGTRVLEGIGRCDGSLPRGNPVDHYDVTLSELQFDERNEIMFERVLIAHDAAEKGDDTGAIKLDAGTIEAIEDAASAPDEKVSAEPGRRSGPPPMPSKTGAATKSVPPAKPEARKSVPPAKPEARKSVPPAKLEPRKSTPPARDSKPEPARARPSSPDDTKLDIERPVHRPRTPSVRPTPIRDEDCHLQVEPSLVARARSLAPRLPRRLLDREDRPGKPEEAVLRAAIRIGLAALGSMADDDEAR